MAIDALLKGVKIAIPVRAAEQVLAMQAPQHHSGPELLAIPWRKQSFSVAISK
jgi:hypothetical protein